MDKKRNFDLALLDVLKNLRIWQIAFLGQSLVVVALLFVVYSMAGRKPVVVAIDSQGRAGFGLEPSQETWKNIATKEVFNFLSDLHSYDAVSVVTARNDALAAMVPSLRAKVQKDVADSTLLMGIIASGTRSRIKWNIPPQIVLWDYPSARFYASFDLEVIDAQGNSNIKTNHALINTTFFGTTKDRPSGHYVTAFQYITDEKTLKDVLNSIGGVK